MPAKIKGIEFFSVDVDHISFYRLFTLRGFKAQSDMIPYLIKYTLIKINSKVKERLLEHKKHL